MASFLARESQSIERRAPLSLRMRTERSVLQAVRRAKQLRKCFQVYYFSLSFGAQVLAPKLCYYSERKPYYRHVSLLFAYVQLKYSFFINNTCTCMFIHP